MSIQEELDGIYVRIGEGEPITDELHNRIDELENILNPPGKYEPKAPKGCGCGYPDQCWDCAAIRGGCPEDV